MIRLTCITHSSTSRLKTVCHVRRRIGAWYLLRGKSRMIERAEVLRMVQASWEEAEDKDQMPECLLLLLGAIIWPCPL